jgi:hypothetical protein
MRRPSDAAARLMLDDQLTSQSIGWPIIVAPDGLGTPAFSGKNQYG